MKSYLKKSWLGGLLALAVMSVALSGVGSAADEPEGGHPIKVMKARYTNDRSRGGSSAKGNCTVWLKNKAEVSVDGIEVEVELYNDSRRKVETLKREIEVLTSGEKKVLTFKWDIPGESTIRRPKIYLSYHSRGRQKTRFHSEPPTWQ